MFLEFHPHVEAEVKSAFDWYEKRSEGLGNRFLDELEKSFDSILENPNINVVLRGNIRRCLVAKFPFAILFSVKPDRIYVLAIMHLKRHPDYWKYRT